MNAHTGEKCFLWEIFRAEFFQISVLNRYISTHAVEKLFHCSISGDTF